MARPAYIAHVLRGRVLVNRLDVGPPWPICHARPIIITTHSELPPWSAISACTNAMSSQTERVGLRDLKKLRDGPDIQCFRLMDADGDRPSKVETN